MIGISADFDPVHIGHEHLILQAREIADREGKEVVVYLNKGFSANHAPFFVDFDARSKMARACGADRIVPIEDLHYRLNLSYSVPIRLAKMIEDGATDYITSAKIPLEEIQQKASKFIKQGNFLGMPRDYPNRNEIRWYGFNAFLGEKLKYHVVKEVAKNGKVSGRLIRQNILENDFEITDEVSNVLPESTVSILEKEIRRKNIHFTRNYDEIFKKMNTYSRGKLEKIAYLNGNIINEIIKRRVYRDEESLWAVFRRSNYGPVMTRLAISAIECEVTKEEVMNLILEYEKKGAIPKAQTINNLINRAWYVSKTDTTASEANERFRNENIEVNAEKVLYAGLNLTRFETKLMKEGLKGDLFINKDNKISIELRSEGKKIKTNLRLPAQEVTYLRYIMDSNFIPVNCEIIKAKKGFKVKIVIAS